MAARVSSEFGVYGCLLGLFTRFYRKGPAAGYDGYFLTSDQLGGVLKEIIGSLSQDTSEVDLPELVTTLLQTRRLESEQERAEALLRNFRICRR